MQYVIAQWTELNQTVFAKVSDVVNIAIIPMADFTKILNSALGWNKIDNLMSLRRITSHVLDTFLKL